jgi:hypothetical protein
MGPFLSAFHNELIKIGMGMGGSSSSSSQDTLAYMDRTLAPARRQAAAQGTPPPSPALASASGGAMAPKHQATAPKLPKAGPGGSAGGESSAAGAARPMSFRSMPREKPRTPIAKQTLPAEPAAGGGDRVRYGNASTGNMGPWQPSPDAKPPGDRVRYGNRSTGQMGAWHTAQNARSPMPTPTNSLPGRRPTSLSLMNDANEES